MTTERTRPLALVTGASTGIGYELARQLAATGHDLVVTADEEAVHEVAAEFAPQGVRAHGVLADLATDDGVDELLSSLAALERAVEIAALNAGVGAGGAFAATPLEGDERVVRLNVLSTVVLAKTLVRDMVLRGQGRLLVSSSVAATMPGPYYATYAASKAFLRSFALALREELGGTGVTVTSLLPGPTDTQIFERSHMEDTRAATGPKLDPTDVARAAVEGLLAGEAEVVAGGTKYRAGMAAARVAPDRAAAKVHARLTKPGSGT